MAVDMIIRSIFALCAILYIAKFIILFHSAAEKQKDKKGIDGLGCLDMIFSLICATLFIVSLSKMGG